MTLLRGESAADALRERELLREGYQRLWQALRKIEVMGEPDGRRALRIAHECLEQERRLNS